MIGNDDCCRGSIPPHDDVAAALPTLAKPGSFESFDALPTGDLWQLLHEALTVSTVIGAKSPGIS